MGSKYGQKLFDKTKKLAAEALKTSSKRVIQKNSKVTGDVVGNEIAEKVTRAVWKSIREDQKKLTASQIDETSEQPTGVPKDSCHHKSDSKLLMRFD